jgi:hypothetical protein
MAALRSIAALAVVLIVLGSAVAAAVEPEPTLHASQVNGGNQTAIIDPAQTIEGATPTPSTDATPLPLETSTPQASPTAGSTPGQTPSPTPAAATQKLYTTPGYGNAAVQDDKYKLAEIKHACSANAPPTSLMLGSLGVVAGSQRPPWIPIAIAVAIAAAITFVVANQRRKRKRTDDAKRAGTLESLSAIVGICVGVAALAAQFIPGATVNRHPDKHATMTVRDIKPRITRGEFSQRMNIDVSEFSKADLAEVGNVVWLEIGLTGFKGQPLDLSYGLYDLNAREALLPDTGKQIPLTKPGHDVQTVFQPVWVGYPRTQRFTAEFRVIDHGGVEQLAATGPIHGTDFRYACIRTH